MEVVYDHGDVASLHQLQHTVAADVASSTSHQDLLCHGSLRGERAVGEVVWDGHNSRDPGEEETGRTWTPSHQHGLGTPCAWPSRRQDIRRGTLREGWAHPANVGHTSRTGRVYLALAVPGENPSFFLLNPAEILQHRSLGDRHPKGQGPAAS